MGLIIKNVNGNSEALGTCFKGVATSINETIPTITSTFKKCWVSQRSWELADELNRCLNEFVTNLKSTATALNSTLDAIVQDHNDLEILGEGYVPIKVDGIEMTEKISFDPNGTTDNGETGVAGPDYMASEQEIETKVNDFLDSLTGKFIVEFDHCADEQIDEAFRNTLNTITEDCTEVVRLLKQSFVDRMSQEKASKKSQVEADTQKATISQ